MNKPNPKQIEQQKKTDEEIKEVNDLIEQRESFREEKNFQDADKIRDKISDKGIELIDHKNKTSWIKKEKILSEKN